MLGTGQHITNEPVSVIKLGYILTFNVLIIRAVLKDGKFEEKPYT